MEKVRVLIADDDHFTAMISATFLSKLGILYDIVDNGEQAIEQLAKKFYNFVLMDIEMPVLNGIEATQKIRSGASGIDRKAIPIVAVSSCPPLTHFQICKDSGMDDYIPKPIEFERFTRTIEKLKLSSHSFAE